MAQKLSIDDFIDVFKDIKPEELPSRFTQKMQKDALMKTLVSYSKLHELQQKLDAALRKVKEIEVLRHGDLKKSALVQKELHELKKNRR